jgi:hypothetical protein
VNDVHIKPLTLLPLQTEAETALSRLATVYNAAGGQVSGSDTSWPATTDVDIVSVGIGSTIASSCITSMLTMQKLPLHSRSATMYEMTLQYFLYMKALTLCCTYTTGNSPRHNQQQKIV